jgi:hypothetical protein
VKITWKLKVAGVKYKGTILDLTLRSGKLGKELGEKARFNLKSDTTMVWCSSPLSPFLPPFNRAGSSISSLLFHSFLYSRS